MTPLLTQIASALCWIVYGSFFEWYWHRYWMHMPRVPKEAFRGHTIVHHGLYKGDNYYVSEGTHPEHILLKPYALPGLVVSHLPIILAIDWFLIPHTAIGAMTACLLYFVVYEYMHWNMHVPRNHFVERFAWFQFLRRHHHLHHRYFAKNFCVLFPLADWVMGTAATEESLAQRKAEREQAIASGELSAERKGRSRGSRDRSRTQLLRLASGTPLSRSLAGLEMRLTRKKTQSRAKWRRDREAFLLTRGRRDR